MYADPMRAWLGPMLPGSLLILDEAHHAAPSSGGKYGIETKFTRAIRDLSERFEHRLFLSATPHNGHSNSFSTLLEILDPYRFTRGVKVRGKKALEDVIGVGQGVRASLSGHSGQAKGSGLRSAEQPANLPFRGGFLAGTKVEGLTPRARPRTPARTPSRDSGLRAKGDLEILVQEGEGRTLELKEGLSSSFAREMVAMANTIGGRILLGVRDDGTITCIHDSNQLRARVQDIARNCDPPIHVVVEPVGEVIVVHVRESAVKPVQGLRATGQGVRPSLC